jgi:hypothetical protein
MFSNTIINKKEKNSHHHDPMIFFDHVLICNDASV